MRADTWNAWSQLVCTGYLIRNTRDSFKTQGINPRQAFTCQAHRPSSGFLDQVTPLIPVAKYPGIAIYETGQATSNEPWWCLGPRSVVLQYQQVYGGLQEVFYNLLKVHLRRVLESDHAPSGRKAVDSRCPSARGATTQVVTWNSKSVTQPGTTSTNGGRCR